jgi:HD-GYP domain-containing protein (c-di-GMP phosphodiesterase class II)
MNALKKCVDIEHLNSFLNRSLRLLPSDSTLFVVMGKKPMLCVGPKVPYAPGNPKTMQAMLHISPQVIATLVLHTPSLSTGNNTSLRQTLDFLAASIDDMAKAEESHRSLAAETLERYRELAVLHRAVLTLNNTLKLKDTLLALRNECYEATIPTDAGCIFLDIQGTRNFNLAQSLGDASIDWNPLVHSRLFADIVIRSKGEMVNDLSSDPRWSDEVPGLNSLIMQPILSPTRYVGILVLTSKHLFTPTHLRHLATLSSVAGVSIANALDFEGVLSLMETLLQALAAAIDARDPFNIGHSNHVAGLTAAFALAVNNDTSLFPHLIFTEDQINEMYYAGILHDIGKISIRKEVLTKATRLPPRLLEIIRVRFELFGRANGYPWQEAFARLNAINSTCSPTQDDLAFIASLSELSWEMHGTTLLLLPPDERNLLSLPHGNLTTRERQEIERHPTEAFRILQAITFPDNFRNLRTIIRQHHEFLDGSGYPDGLQNDEILPQSRILAIANIFTALTQGRHNEPAVSRDAALQILRDESSKGRLDPILVALFCDHIDDIQPIALHSKRQHSSLNTPTTFNDLV